MNHDSDPWVDTLPPDLSAIRVQFDPADQGKTISAEWAHEILRMIYAARPATFKSKFADLYESWTTGSFKAGPP